MESTLQELNDFFKEFEEIKNSNKELVEFNALLQEELRLARDAERSAESKKTRCQAFLNQQQEVIQRLLTVKEENENLKYKLCQTEKTLSMIQNINVEEQMRKDAKIQEIEQEYLNKVNKVQKDAEQQADKAKSEYLDTVSALKTSVSELEEKVKEKDGVINSLKESLQNLKDWSDANMEAFHKKLTEQERKHQSEIETWKVAELNRTMFEQAQPNNTATLFGTGQNYQHMYQPPQVLRHMQDYQSNIRFQEQMPGYQKTPLVTHYKNVLPRHNTNMQQPLSASGNYHGKTDFISANNLYMKSHKDGTNNEEEYGNTGEKMKENNKPILTQKPKILVPNKKRKLFNNNQNML